MSQSDVPIFSVGPDDQALLLLQRLRDAFLLHPRAGVALFDALVGEGRRYAGTEEGAALMQKLQASPLLSRLEEVFDLATLGVLTDTESETIDLTALADAFYELAIREDAWQMGAGIEAQHD